MRTSSRSRRPTAPTRPMICGLLRPAPPSGGHDRVRRWRNLSTVNREPDRWLGGTTSSTLSCDSAAFTGRTCDAKGRPAAALHPKCLGQHSATGKTPRPSLLGDRPGALLGCADTCRSSRATSPSGLRTTGQRWAPTEPRGKREGRSPPQTLGAFTELASTGDDQRGWSVSASGRKQHRPDHR